MSGKCRNILYRKQKRQKLLELFDNKCCICGYNRLNRALEFHHVFKENKKFNLSHDNMRFGWIKVLEEVRKCILLCSNCHQEVEANLIPFELVLSLYEAQSKLLDAGCDSPPSPPIKLDGDA